MIRFNALVPGLLSLALLASPALAQTQPAHKTTSRRLPPAPPKPRMVSNTSPAARAADPLRGTNDNGKGQGSYAAPGEPINVQENGKNTPSYDGPAAGHGNKPKGMTIPHGQ